MIAADPSVSVELGHTPAITFALEQAGVPIVHSVSIRNGGAEPLPPSVLTIELLPDLGPPTRVEVPPLRPGEVAERGAVDIRLPPDRLRTALEAERGQLTWRLTAEGRVLAEGSRAVQLLAYNEWPGGSAPDELLAMYVTPNHPVVTSILRRVRDRLRATQGDDALDGYQSRSPSRVRNKVIALYESLQTFGISYQQCLASFERDGQKVRFADRVLGDQLANCLDMTLLAASCLEQMGLHPLLVLVKNHAFPGVWLTEERFPECVVQDAARLRTAVALGELVFFDSSTIVLYPPPPFEEARAVASDYLADDERFDHAIDVGVARINGYRPLPLRDVARFEPSPVDEARNAKDDQATQAVRAVLHEASQVPMVAPPPPSPSQRPSEPLDPMSARLKRWRDRLLDLSLRNRLLNFRDTKASLPLDVLDVAAFEDALAVERVFELFPRASSARDPRDPGLLAARTCDQEEAERRAKEFARGNVYSSLPETEFAKRVIHLDRTARSDLEEGGANTLFAAIGFLRWYESEHSDVAREAPLLLVPVALERQRITGRVRLRGLPEDSIPNVTLIEKLRRDFDVDLTRLASLEADEHGRDVPAMLQLVRQAIRHIPRWEVCEEAALGLFTFSKFLMWRDLEDNAGLLLESPVVRHIASAARSPFPNEVPQAEPRALDDTVAPSRLPLVVDADSTQMAAIVSGLSGRSFVLQGPPGTGKSQTITNLIAACLAEGRTVLFISEKMAALEVVKRRLEQTGLGDFCLELHSHKAQKKEVIDSLGKSLSRALGTKASAWEPRSIELARLRSELNAYTRALHQARPLGMSFHRASARLLALESAPRIDVPFASVTATTDAQLRGLLEAAGAYAASAREVGPVAAHPFRDARLGAWSSQVETSLSNELANARRASAAVSFAGQRLATMLGLPFTSSLASLDEMTHLAMAASAGPLPPSLLDEASATHFAGRAHAFANEAHHLALARRELTTRWNDELLTLDLEPLAARFSRYANAFFLVALFVLWGARSRLRSLAKGALPDNRHIDRDLALARSVQSRAAWVDQEKQALASAFAGCWSAEAGEDVTPLLTRAAQLRSALTRYRTSSSGSPGPQLLALVNPSASTASRQELAEQARAVSHAITTLRRHLEPVFAIVRPSPSALPPESSPSHLPTLEQVLSRWQEGLRTFRSFCFYRAHEEALAAWGAGPIVAAHQAGSLREEDLVAATERAFLQAWTNTIRDAEPALRSFDGTNQDRLVARFRKADAEHIELSRQRVAELVEARRPHVEGTFSDASETGKLQRELRKKTRHMPVRRLLTELPNLVPRLKPCFLMSPMSVAQYLPAGGRQFDVVVFDEASQIGTHDAIGAIARGKQVVIVGDSKQLPPTSFFQRGVSEDEPIDENDVEELESILDEALASGIPEQMLGWHYRSRHEALIDFSNQHYYEGRLNVFPAARGRVDELGVSLHPIADGVYDKSKTRTNRKEAEALVAHLVHALRMTQPGSRSFGVVTFSQAQQALLQDLLDEACSRDPAIEAHFASDRVEPVFVKNLENVQGDERDEILFSVGYGPDENGRVFMHFGPLNRQGGERRLNVAVTRAREKLRVFSSLTHEQIDLSRTSARGARHLKAFLRYVAERSASSPQRVVTSGDFDSEFERQVHDALVAKGYRVDCQVGCGAYRIDLAVVHPDQPGVYVLGIECDGATYHSAATARDRDRLRQSVLEGLGWRLHRVWSTDFWFQREREIEKLDQAIQDAIREASKPAPTPPKPLPARTPPPEPRPSATMIAHAAPAQALPKAVHVAPPSPVVPYERARLVDFPQGPAALYEPLYANEVYARVFEVLRVEAPIHLDELARRVGASFGQGRLTERLRSRVMEMLRMLSSHAVLRADFVWRSDQAPASWTSVRVSPEGEDARSLELVPDEELAAAAAWVLSRSFSTTQAELLREIARLFGFARAGAKVTERALAGVELLRERGGCVVTGERVEWREG